MLEEIKKVLINNLQQELQQRKEIDKEIKEVVKERDQKLQQLVQNLSQLQIQIEEINKKTWHRIIHRKNLNVLYLQYRQESNLAIEEMKKWNEKIESLYQKIHDLSHDEALIEKEIDRIRKATSFPELGLTERAALNYIKSDDRKVIRAVFKDIKDSQRLETKTDIERNINILYQTNLSPFVVAMQRIRIEDLIKELLEIGIIIDEEKIKLLELLKQDTKSYIEISYLARKEQETTDPLDYDFYNQVKADLENMQYHTSNHNITISKIMTLAVLISIAKTNKKRVEVQK